MPLFSDWSAFFSAELAALASLTGFVVVAISINLNRILSFATLPGRAVEALIAPVGAITATSLVLIPEQTMRLVGSEVFAVGIVMVLTPAAIQARAWRERKHAPALARITRPMTTAGFSLAFVVGGGLLIAGARAGLFWIAGGDILCLIAIVFSAWVLMVEILR